MALDGNERKELYRKMINDPATARETRQYSFSAWEKKLLEDEKAIGRLADFAVNKNWAIDRDDFVNTYIPEFAQAPPVTKETPVQAPPARAITPPVGIAAPKTVREPSPSVTDITREMAFEPPMEAPVKPIGVMAPPKIQEPVPSFTEMTRGPEFMPPVEPRKPKEEERGWMEWAGDIAGAVLEDGKRITKNLLGATGYYAQAQAATDPMANLPYEKRQQMLQEAGQTMYDIADAAQKDFQKEVAKRNIQTDVLTAIENKQYKKVPEAVLYTIGDAAMQIVPSVFTMGGSSFMQTLPSAYKDGVEAIAKEKGISPEQVIANGEDAILTATITSGIIGALDKYGADRIGGFLSNKAGYKAVRDWLLKQNVNKTIAKGAQLLGVSLSEAGTEYAQEGAQQAGAIAAKSPTLKAFFEQLPNELFTPEAERQRRGAAVGGFFGAGGLGVAGKGISQAYQYATKPRTTELGPEPAVEAAPIEELTAPPIAPPEITTETEEVPADLMAAAERYEQAPVEETIQIAPLNIDFAKNEGRNVDYQGIQGRIKIDSDGTPYVFTKDGDIVYIEGGLSGQTPQQLGVQPLADDVINEADVETILQDDNAPLDQNQLEYDFDNNTVTLYGKPFTYEGVETNSKGQTTALRLRDANGKVKFVRNEDTILEFEIQKELYEKSRTNRPATIESATAAAQQLQVVPVARIEQVPKPVQQEGPIGDIAQYEITPEEETAPAPVREELNIVEPDSELSQKILDNGEQVVSRLDAEKRIGDGERLFGFNEQDDSLVELSLQNLDAFPVDTIIAVRPEVIEEAPEAAPEVVSAAPVEEVAPEAPIATTTDSKGRVSRFFKKEETKSDGTKVTTFQFERSDKGGKRFTAVTGVPVNEVIGDQWQINENDIPPGEKPTKIVELREANDGRVAATVVFENEEELTSQGEVTLTPKPKPEAPAAPAPKGRKKKEAPVTPAPAAPKKEEAPKPEPTAKKIDKKSVQASLDKAKEEYEKAKSAFDKKRSELDKTTREDVKNLFGERKVEMKAKGLFEMPRISPEQRERAIQPFRDRMNKAKEEVNRLTKMLEEGEEAAKELTFEKEKEYEQVQGTGKETRKGKGAPKTERVVRPKAKPVRNAGKTPDAITARNITFYSDPFATSLQYLMDATYHPDLLESIFGGPSRTTKSGRKDISGERKARIQFLDKTSNIKSADRLGEYLAERYAEENNIDVKDAEEQHDFASIATDIISSYSSRNQMVRELLRLNEQQNDEFEFMYNPEAIYGEGYNEDIAKEIDNILDELPDSYWEEREITDEEYGNLFAEEVEPETKEGKKAEAKEEKPASVVSEKDIISAKIKEIAEKFKSIESELQGEIDVQDFSDRLRKRYEEIKSQYGEAKANEVLKSESNRADKIIKESRDGILKRLKGEYFKKNGVAPSSIRDFQKGIDSGEYKIDDLPSYKDAVSAKIVEEAVPSAPSFTSEQSSEAATAFDKGITIEEKGPDSDFSNRTLYSTDEGKLEIGKRKGRKYYSVLELFVNEESRRKGTATKLLKQAIRDTKGLISSQVSNDVSLEAHYKLGMRAYENGKELSLDEAKKLRQKQTSVNVRFSNAEYEKELHDLYQKRAQELSDIRETRSSNNALQKKYRNEVKTIIDKFGKSSSKDIANQVALVELPSNVKKALIDKDFDRAIELTKSDEDFVEDFYNKKIKELEQKYPNPEITKDVARILKETVAAPSTIDKGQVSGEAKTEPGALKEFTSTQSSEITAAFDKAKTSKGFDKKYGKGAYKALSDITKNFEDIMDKVSDKIKQDCL